MYYFFNCFTIDTIRNDSCIEIILKSIELIIPGLKEPLHKIKTSNFANSYYVIGSCETKDNFSYFSNKNISFFIAKLDERAHGLLGANWSPKPINIIDANGATHHET